MRRPLLILTSLALLAPWARAKEASPKKADAKLQAELKKAGARPGGILRVLRVPEAARKGWTMTEDREEAPAGLTAPGDGFFYFVDEKAGPQYEHAVRFVFVDVKGEKVVSVDASWWPTVKDAQGRVHEPVEKQPADDADGWWLRKAYRVFGGDGPSIQDGQDAIKFDWMMSPLPAGSDGLVLYSCPATLPKGGSLGAGEKTLWKATGDAFVFFVDFHRGKDFPHEVRIVVWPRDTKEAQVFEVQHAPVLWDAAGKSLETADSGKPLGTWWADDAHSFLARMSFGR